MSTPRERRSTNLAGWLAAGNALTVTARTRPERVARAFAGFATTMAGLPAAVFRQSVCPIGRLSELDPRFTDSGWDRNAWLFAVGRAYVAGCDLLEEIADAGEFDARARRHLAWVQDVTAPTNFSWVGPNLFGLRWKNPTAPDTVTAVPDLAHHRDAKAAP